MSAIVTGGASGIGAASARQLAARGAKVVVADLQVDRGAELAKEIGGAFVSVDVTNTEQIEAAVIKAAELGPLGVLVNSAGIGGAQRTIGKDGEFASAHNLDAYKKVIAINLIGTFDCIRLAATAMSRNEPMDSSRERESGIQSFASWPGYPTPAGGIPIRVSVSRAGAQTVPIPDWPCW
ncbi:MAG: hypothetical protein QOF67_582 [Mycobacterium sp.]|nr:hypothetical protein [Mycobacterium sp.]